MKQKIPSILLSLLIVLMLCQIAIAIVEENCDNLNPVQAYDLPVGPSGKQSLVVIYEVKGSQNYPILIYLQKNKECRNVLYTEGRGIRFIERKAQQFPDIEVYWHYGASDNRIAGYYTWNGVKYVNIELTKSEDLNKQALKLFNQGNIRDAIKLWEQAIKLAIIPGLGYTSNSDALNNLGFAYYKLGLKTRSEEHFHLAQMYLEQTTEVDPARWVAYLNLGDLFVELDWPERAVENYKKLLELNPDYKNAEKIKIKISKLSEKINVKQ